MRDLLIFGTLALTVAGCFLVSTPKQEEPTYTLLGYSENGNEYVLDSGLSLDDCRKHEYDVRFGYTICEQEA